MNYAKIRNEFTAYVQKVIRESSIDYVRKISRITKHEKVVADFIELPESLLSVDDSDFFVEKNISYANIETVFTSEKHYRAMKMLSDNEKLVIFLTVIEDKSAGQVADIMHTSKNTVWNLKSKAIKKFKKFSNCG